jgi:hypothetical protein
MRNSRGRLGTAWTLGIVAGLLALAAGHAAAIDGESLRLLLLGAQDNNTPQTMLRADIGIALETYKGPRKTQAIAFFAPGKEALWYFQMKEPALEALVRGSERKVMQRSGGSIKTMSIGEPIADLGISYEDLSRFVVDDYKLWQIADEGTDVVLAGGHPQVESAYVYRAYTFDKAKPIWLKVQFYAKALNNLVKLRTDSDHVLVGKKRFPGKIEIQNFVDNSKVTLTIKWSQAAAAPPEIFVPESFAGAALIPWEAAAPVAKATP